MFGITRSVTIAIGVPHADSSHASAESPSLASATSYPTSRRCSARRHRASSSSSTSSSSGAGVGSGTRESLDLYQATGMPTASAKRPSLSRTYLLPQTRTACVSAVPDLFGELQGEGRESAARVDEDFAAVSAG